MFSKFQQCYISFKMLFVSSGIQDQILLLLDIFPSLDKCEKKIKNLQQLVSDAFEDSERVFIELYFFDNGLNSQ